MTATPQNIPSVLRERPHWFLHDAKKCPVFADGKPASYTNPKNYSSFDEILTCLRKTELSGIGYVFDNSDPFVGVDLDGCRIPTTGEITDWAREIVETLNSYTEISPSGTGLKIFLQGTSPYPKGRNERIAFVEKITDKTPGFEIYDHLRFFTVTGNHLEGTPLTINSSSKLKAICEKYLPGEKPKPGAIEYRQSGNQTEDEQKIVERCRSYLQKKPGAVSGQNGHGDTFSAACIAVIDFGLCNDVALGLLEEWNQKCEPPWADHELRHKIEDASRQSGPRNRLRYSGDDRRNENNRHRGNGKPSNWQSPSSASECVVIANAGVVEYTDDKGTKKTRVEPLSVNEFVELVHTVTGGIPYRVGNELFIQKSDGEIHWIKDHPALISYVSSVFCCRFVFHQSIGCVNRSELYEALRFHGKSFDSVEHNPHEPSIPNFYYACDTPPVGDGKMLHKLIAKFTPETQYDRDLIICFFATLFWGVVGGVRPIFLAASDDGRASGKSALIPMGALLVGGSIDVGYRDDAAKIKSRILSKDAVGKRLMFLDNLKSYSFSMPEIEALVTAPSISGWKFYAAEGSKPNTLTWAITSNGASFSEDMALRTVTIKLKRPEYSGTWQEDTQAFITENRQAIIGDLIAFLQSPKNPLDKHSRWGKWEEEILRRTPEPNECQQVILDRQKEIDVEGDENELMEEYFQQKLAELRYDTDGDNVFISNSIARTWTMEATGDHYTTRSVRQMFKQRIKEKKFSRIQECRLGKTGRGFKWCGDTSSDTSQIHTDLKQRKEINNEFIK